VADWKYIFIRIFNAKSRTIAHLVYPRRECTTFSARTFATRTLAARACSFRTISSGQSEIEKKMLEK
jgi:hypothetical protein